MKTQIALLLFCPLMLCCRTSEPQQSNAYEYEKAEVYYAKAPNWYRMGWNIKLGSFFDKQARDMLFSRFTISDRDSIRYIENRLSKGEMTFSPAYNYWSPRIIVLLHSHDRVDTLITSTYTDEPMQFNSYVMENTTLTLYLTECVGRHDRLWAYALDRFFYNGNMQMFTREGEFFFLEDDSLNEINWEYNYDLMKVYH